MGNQTTSRVESQPESFKYYLGSDNSSFDTLIKRAPAQITNQQSRIRQALQESMNSISRSLRHNFFIPLYRHVSIFSLEQLLLEHNRMLDWVIMYLTNAVVHFKAPMDCRVLVNSINRSGHKVRCIWMTFIHS